MNKKNHHILLSFLTIGSLVGCAGKTGTSTTDNGAVSINSVVISQTDATNKPAEFNTQITLNSNIDASTWQFGFYMPRSFDTSTAQKINTELSMKICVNGSETNCANLVYQLADSITDNDLSAGYTTMLAPETAFPLTQGTSYQISLNNNNQWAPGNSSALPQNFFMVVNESVINIPTTTQTYRLENYNATAVNERVQTHITDIWQNSATATPSVNLIPMPVSYALTSNLTGFTFGDNVAIHNQLNNDNTVVDMYVADIAVDKNIFAASDNSPTATTGIIIQPLLNPAEVDNNPEGYKVVINAESINVYALNNVGALYALQSLRQLWNESQTIAAATIIDYPRFKYRGVLLDVARHYFEMNEIKNLIDVMVFHKLNTLHMHFADDEAFRIDLDDSFPTLETIADSRGFGYNSMTGLMFLQSNLDITNIDNLLYPYVDTTYQKTYSKADIEAMKEYANARNITIIPEIDTPGHARAMIKALPDAFVDPNDQSEFISVQGYNDDVLPICTYNSDISVGTEFTKTINSIFSEAVGLFNNQTTLYAINNEMSVGGDEVSSQAWTNDSSCQGEWNTFVATTTNPISLQRSQYFFQLFAQSNPSIVMSGWQQVIQSESDALGSHIFANTQAGHIWVWNTSQAGLNQAVTLAENGYPVVLDYADLTYFDLAYTPQVEEVGYTWATGFSDTYSSLSSALAASNTINAINPTNQDKILGIEGALWSENLASYTHMTYMAIPKMAGLAEAAWSPATLVVNNDQVNWQSLAGRLGCGDTGFLSYIPKFFGMYYRGYPNGIKLEVPSQVCPNS